MTQHLLGWEGSSAPRNLHSSCPDVGMCPLLTAGSAQALQEEWLPGKKGDPLPWYPGRWWCHPSTTIPLGNLLEVSPPLLLELDAVPNATSHVFSGGFYSCKKNPTQKQNNITIKTLAGLGDGCCTNGHNAEVSWAKVLI